MDPVFSKPPVLGFAAYSGSGKTTLLAQILPVLAERGLRVGIIKHSHHDFEIDQPGKDSHRLRKAGARQMLLASPWRTAWIEETPDRQEPRLEELLRRLDRTSLDLVLVEGFRHVAFPKIEIHRSAAEKPFLYTEDTSIIALACDQAPDIKLPCLDLNQPQKIVEFIFDFMKSTEHGAAV